MQRPELPASEGLRLEKTLPTHFYTAPEIFAQEKERIFAADWSASPAKATSRSRAISGWWMCWARACCWYATARARCAASSMSCRHRGAELCGPKVPGGARQGGVIDGKRIRCPYHSWVYSLDGELVGAPHLSTEANFDPSNSRFIRSGVECWGGFVFVHLSPQDAVPLAEILGAIPARLRRYPLDRMLTGM